MSTDLNCPFIKHQEELLRAAIAVCEVFRGKRFTSPRKTAALYELQHAIDAALPCDDTADTVSVEPRTQPI